MTAEEWQTCTNGLSMLDALPRHGNDRPLRAFVCACCRQLWHLLPTESRDALAMAEAYARKAASDRDLEHAHAQAEAGRRRVRQGTSFKKRKVHPQERAALVVVAATSPDARGAAREAILALVDLFGTQEAELLRKFIDNPFRSGAEPGTTTDRPRE
jgi:hypothetical protein